jgi:serine/threonine protein kinase
MAKSLHDAIIEYGKIISTEFIASITKELLLAIQYSHSKDIVHLNLNLKNILILS